MHNGVNGRRKSALLRLQTQLKSGKKSNGIVETDLTEKDRNRIENEIGILNSRITI